MKKTYFLLFVLFSFLFDQNTSLAQTKKKKNEEDVYKFEMIHQVKTTPVKNQAKTGTCWSFATASFIETELLRMGKGEHILSPMWFVRHAYPEKAQKFVRYSGSTNFSVGGQAHDVMNVIRKKGMVPEANYKGMNIGEEEHNHGEMAEILDSYVNAVKRNKGGKITPKWQEGFESILDIYLGKSLNQFNYLGRNFTPTSFRDSLGFNPNNYVEFTSYTHHPFYSKFDLEIPDNWSHDDYYNIPFGEMIALIDTALARGYSVLWDGDTSEKGFDRKKGIAIIPQVEIEEIEKDADEKKTEEPVNEKFITQEMRQETFDNQATTDDHLMHITGMAKDHRGYKFYYVKNSWGTKDKKYNGYWYMSEIYIRLKTVAIMVQKDAIPGWLKNKLKM